MIIRELYDVGTEINTNTIEYDNDIYKDFKQAIRTILNICRPVLQLTPEIKLVLRGDIIDTREESFPTEIDNVPVSFFTNYRTNIEELNIENQRDYFTKLIGCNLNYKTTDGSISTLVSAEFPWRNMLNRYGPVVTNKPKSNLRSLKEIGSFYTPQHTGLLTYYSHKPTPIDTGLSVNDVVTDLSRFGNSYVSGVTGMSVDHIENVEWLKADISNDALHGDITITEKAALFYGYTSTDEIRPGSHSGTSRYDDKYGFFKGPRNDIWANSDVFEVEAQNIYDIDSRQDTLLVGHDTVHTWRDDIYGNNFSLYKPIEPVRLPTDSDRFISDDFRSSAGCVIIDGGDTLLPRETRFERDYIIYDGGRHPDNDPKIEQFISYTPFPDLRKIDPETGSKVPHNTYYYGVGLDGSEIGYNPVTFHGFNPSPNYDKQAYGGLFTDDACGIISSRYTTCEIADNYSFVLFTEGPDENGNYVSRSSPASGFDAFEEYANPHFDDFDPDIGFSFYGANSSIQVTTLPAYDGSTFTAECDFADSGFEYEVDQSAVLFLDTLTVSKTKYATPEEIDKTKPTLYQQKTDVSGKVFFRSYNDKIVDNISTALKPVWDGFVSQRNTAFEIIESDLREGNVVNMDIMYDCMLIETKDYLLLEKVNFDPGTTTVLPNKTTNVLLNTGVDKQVEKCADSYFNENKVEAIVCMTKMLSSDNGQVLTPVIYTVDLNTLQYRQAFPNKDYGIQECISSFDLPEDLSDYVVSEIDRPVITYDSDTVTYNVSYSGYLSGSEGDVKYCVFTSDFKRRKLNFEVIETAVYHGKSVPKYTKPGASWEPEVLEKTLRLYAPKEETPVNGETKKFTLDSDDFIGHTLSGRSFDLNLDCKYFPVGDNKIIEIAFDPGDGGPIVRNERKIEVGFVDVSFDITELPDQNDFGDPRKDNIKHQYIFNEPDPKTFTPTVTALYSDFSRMIFEINIHTSPSTIASSFNGLKLLNTKSYINTNNKHEQLLVLESQYPQCITNVVVSKNLK